MPRKKIPDSIRLHKYSFIFEPEWRMIHNTKKGNSLAVICGGLGSGKTYAALRRGEILGVTEGNKDLHLFDPDHLEDHVCFDKIGFDRITAMLKEKGTRFSRGYNIVLDEAEIDLYSKDFQKDTVKDLTKKFATIRSRRYCIALTLPSFGMLNADIRRLVNYYCQMEKVNLQEKISYSTFNYLKTNPFTNVIYRHKPTFKEIIIGMDGLPMIKRTKLSRVEWDLPSKSVRKKYEELKDAFLDELDQSQFDKSEARVKKANGKVSLSETIIEKISKDVERFKKDGRLNWVKVKSEFGCSRSLASDACRIVRDRLELE